MPRTDITALGMWEGVEVEHTKFYGLRTLFINRYGVLQNCTTNLDYPHIFIDLTDLNFYDKLHTQVEMDTYVINLVAMLCAARKVTIAVLHTHRIILECTPLRVSPNFCLLITIPLALPDLGGYAVKIQPSTIFTSNEHEGGVYTVDASVFGYTKWVEYIGDKDV